jgi:hypothetical protein
MAVYEPSIHPFPAQGHGSSVLLDPMDIAHDASVVELECRQAILTSLLLEDELIGRLRSSMVVAKARKDGGQ